MYSGMNLPDLYYLYFAPFIYYLPKNNCNIYRFKNKFYYIFDGSAIWKRPNYDSSAPRSVE